MVCGITWLGGTAAVVASEVDRAGDIEPAEKALARTERYYWKANSRWQHAMHEERTAGCITRSQESRASSPSHDAIG